MPPRPVAPVAEDEEFEQDEAEVQVVTSGVGPEDYRQAEWLAQRLRKQWRYDHTAKQWHHFDGVRWAPDQTESIHYAIRETATGALKKKGVGEYEQKRLFALLQWPTQERVLKALATYPGYGTNGDEWDSDPFLLGVKNGVVDLRTNTLIPGAPEQNVTKTTGFDFAPAAGPEDFATVAPRFMEVMNEWMSGDTDMVEFLLCWFGASMFGFSPEQRFLLMTGIGRNGKGALKHALLHATGDYSDELDPALYMRTKFGAARSNEARADLMKLKGLRLTFFSEPQGGVFNEELLKAHTGQDRISARALYSNNVQSWDPTHSINFLTNNLPAVEDVGPSMAERVMVVDFRESYEGDRQDRRLYGKLEDEAPGILAILVWCASLWYRRWNANIGGLILPERVVEQSRDFMERNDPVANWLNERCRRGRDLTQPSQVAYESYLEWHNQSQSVGEAFSMVRWSAQLQKKGMTKSKTPLGMRWHGFNLFGASALAEKDIDEEEP
jgi:putative DNA primase/helicase